MKVSAVRFHGLFLSFVMQTKNFASLFPLRNLGVLSFLFQISLGKEGFGEWNKHTYYFNLDEGYHVYYEEVPMSSPKSLSELWRYNTM